METVLKLFQTGTFRRWGVGLIVSALIAANAKFDLGLTIETMGMIAGIAIALILGSNYKEAQSTLASAQETVALAAMTPAASKPKTDSEAAAIVAGVK